MNGTLYKVDLIKANKVLNLAIIIMFELEDCEKETQTVSWYEQDILQSHNADQSTA